VKLRRSLYTVKSVPDITPLVDVVLLLLIFFMLTSSFVFQPGIKIDPPRGPGLGGVNTRHIISMAAQVPPLIFFNDQITTTEKLEKQLEKLAHEQANATVVIKADKKVPHGQFVQVMNLVIKSGLSVVIATQPDKPVPVIETAK
jgi:biopolymer transport protein ExbD